MLKGCVPLYYTEWAREGVVGKDSLWKLWKALKNKLYTFVLRWTYFRAKFGGLNFMVLSQSFQYSYTLYLRLALHQKFHMILTDYWFFLSWWYFISYCNVHRDIGMWYLVFCTVLHLYYRPGYGLQTAQFNQVLIPLKAMITRDQITCLVFVSIEAM